MSAVGITMNVRLLSRPDQSIGQELDENIVNTVSLRASTSASSPSFASFPSGSPGAGRESFQCPKSSDSKLPIVSPPQSPSSCLFSECRASKRPFLSPPLSPASTCTVPPLSSSAPSAHLVSSSISKTCTQCSGSTAPALASMSSAATNGIVVVGIIGRVVREVSGLFDRLLDSHVLTVKHRTWKQRQGSRGEASPSEDCVNRERIHSKTEHQDCESKESGALDDDRIAEKFESTGNNVGSQRGTEGENWNVRGGCCSWQREGNAERPTDEKAQVANEDPVTSKRTSARGGVEEDGRPSTSENCVEANGGIHRLLRKLKYHHDDEKGMLYVQYTWGDSTFEHLESESVELAAAGAFSSCLELKEADNLRGLLIMFSVCHVILMVQEGADFDPHLLRILRLLQAAKQCLMPCVKAQLFPELLPAPSSVNRSSLIKSTSPGAGHVASRTGIVGRPSSTIALMSGSTPFLIPGQCIPVVLFVCLEDLGESAMGISPRPTVGSKDVPQPSVVSSFKLGSVFSNPGKLFSSQAFFLEPVTSGAKTVRTNKTQSGQRKRLQVTMESQIRYLFKKCRTVAGLGEVGPPGCGGTLGMASRGQGNIASPFQGLNGNAALFVLDPSKAVVVLDKSAIWLPVTVDHAVNGTEAKLVGEQGLEDLLGDSSSNAGISGEDVHAVKDFLSRQAEILRGKGGISATAAGGASGVGMVAAAAAAAAASAASAGLGSASKAICNPPELPTFSNWLSVCQGLAEALYAQAAGGNELSSIHKPSRGTCTALARGTISPKISARPTGKVTRKSDSMDSVFLALDGGFNVDIRFSATWCKKVLVTAQKAYLKGLPLSYSSNCHKFQLKRALGRFQSIVRGPAVCFYTEKLRKECDEVWQSGRQLCYAESLTGNPCVHLVHEVEEANATSISQKDDCRSPARTDGEENKPKPHSSGVVFLHACACGRSRKLRKDPFDFKSANVSFFKFSNCEDLLPSLTPPTQLDSVASKDSPWSLVCLGKSVYYQPTVGLVQPGFCSEQNFLSFWDIPVVYSAVKGLERTLVGTPGYKVAELVSSSKDKAILSSQVNPVPFLPWAQPVFNTRPVHDRLYRKAFKNGCSYAERSFTAEGDRDGSVRACAPADLARTECQSELVFPLHFHRQNELTKLFVNIKPPQCSFLKFIGDKCSTYSASRSLCTETNYEEARPALTEDAINRTSFSGRAPNVRFRKNHVRLYIGFEHECPNGHRFLLSRDAPTNPVPSDLSPVADEGRREKGNSIWTSKQPRNDSCVKMTSMSPGGVNPGHENSSQVAMDPFHSLPSKLAQEPNGLQHRSIHEGLGGLHLLNSNIPIYMRCPHCKVPKKSERSKSGVVYGGILSQLQRIFLVTPPLPVVLASRPTVKFKDISKPGITVMEFNGGNEVVLPPDSFLSLRLPFVYYSERDGVPHKPILVNQSQPEQCAWLVRDTAIYLLSGRGS